MFIAKIREISEKKVDFWCSKDYLQSNIKQILKEN